MTKTLSTLFLTLIILINFPVNAQSNKPLNLMPVPWQMELKNGKFRLGKDFSLQINGNPHERIYEASNRFLQRLDKRTGLLIDPPFSYKPGKLSDPHLQIQITRPGKVMPDMEESYVLEVQAEKIFLTAETDLGAMHGLETLLQLLDADAEGYYFPAIEVNDEPRFEWRGLMIDCARHFQPIEVLERNLDAMSAVKMNVFHWHLTEDQGWRFESKKFPKLTEMGSDGLFYTQDQILDLIAYADARGIRVVPEIDVPGHSTALLMAYPELGSAAAPTEIELRAGIMDPTLNPIIEETYQFLDTLFKEVADIFPDPYFHIGGDENNGKQWDANPEIQAYMNEHGYKDNHALQTMFNKRLLPSLTKYGKKMMGWDEILQEDLPKDAVIHSWRGREAMLEAAQKGYQTVLSNGYYIDLIEPTSKHYLNDPLPGGHDLTPQQAAFILGGEATMWSELVTPLVIDSRIWPRTAAIAERLWSPISVQDLDDMYRRLDVIDYQLEEFGLKHNTARDVIMRNLCRGFNTEPLRVLLDVVEPLKGYTRNPGGDLYRMTSPFTLFADAARPDAKVARDFRKTVDRYLKSKDENDRFALKSQLSIWQANHKRLQPIIDQSPVLKEVEQLSENLSTIAGIGLKALEGTVAHDEAIFEAARDQGGRTELMVVNAIEALVKGKE